MSVPTLREHKMRPLFPLLSHRMPVPLQRVIIYLLPAACRQGTPVPPRREHNTSPAKLFPPVTNHSRNMCLTFCRWYALRSPNPAGTATSSTRTATSCTTSTASHSNGIQVQPARITAVILQEASDRAPPVSDQFVAYIGGTDLAMLLNKNTFEPDAAVTVITEASASKDTWCMVALVVRGLLRRPSLSGTPTVTFCSVHVTMSWPRSASPQRLFFAVSTPTWCNTTSTSSVVTST